ncbi:DNA-3-methyladenine glycosylase [Alteribacillus persepolensis]|uniref:Putative 3-methyladenine DNA glycosylase n=1 Tax=Alteribacillus persepolensis TaxID=568899 RepID=A0A1G8C322_9BACI|nr:DNA-3-methyladenine glycosylase [Alteribacillus persepolensis]SDH39866.1 DNA-3-methyladenine glycosylase [Alteribacillus persepolensis]
MKLSPVREEFFHYPTLEMAQRLLGHILVKETNEGVAAGKIVETEAYQGPDDRAAHSFGNRRTKRTEVMFGPPGYVYTYEMHTHCLVNVVCEKPGIPQAVLIRGVEPVEGIELMYKRRGDKKERDLTSGPGKLTKALGIVKADYGRAFFERPLYIAQGTAPSNISSGPRIGIGNAGEAKDYPWRFWETGNSYVSK